MRSPRGRFGLLCGRSLPAQDGDVASELPEDRTLIMQVLMEIREDVRAIRSLLEDDEEEERDDEEGS